MPERKNGNIDVSVDNVIFGFDEDKLKVLVIERKPIAESAKGMNAIPGDLVYPDESLDKAAARILKDLTSLEGLFLKQFHTFGDPDRVKGIKDQEWLRNFRAHPERRVITVAYYSLVKMDDYQLIPSYFAEKADWVDILKVPDLAFDHNQIVTLALDALRYGLEHEQIGFELLPEKFTLTQLQNLHEIILNKKFDKRNFRKNIKKMEHVIPLNEKQEGVLHKPAQLFKFDKDVS
ncbi:MAG: NUDIX domain-containing protein [Flavobacteriales bacterium]